MRKDILIAVGASVASAGVASAVTWVLTKRSLQAEYDERLSVELDQSVKYILKKLGVENVIVTDEDPDAIIDELNDIEQPIDIVVAELDEVEGERVFASEAEKPPLDELVARNQTIRYDKVLTPDEPETPDEFPENVDQVEEDPDISVISRDAFMANETEWEQVTLTYFADGGVLDVMQEFVEDHEDLIGPGRPRFGEESDDANVVYVRNHRLNKEYEILSDPGNATEFLAHSLGELYKPAWAQ